MPLHRSFAALITAVVLAAVPPAQAQGQSQSKSQSKSQGQSQSQSQSQSQGQSQGQSQSQGQGQGQGQSDGRDQGQGRASDGATALPGGSDGDFALEAVRSRRALPLADILARVRGTLPGEVIDARLVSIRGFLVYEVKSMTGDGHVHRSYYYARSGRKVGTD